MFLLLLINMTRHFLSLILLISMELFLEGLLTIRMVSWAWRSLRIMVKMRAMQVRGSFWNYWHTRLAFWTLGEVRNFVHGKVKRDDWTGRKREQVGQLRPITETGTDQAGLWLTAVVNCTHLIKQSTTAVSRKAIVLTENVVELDSITSSSSKTDEQKRALPCGATWAANGAPLQRNRPRSSVTWTQRPSSPP